MASSPSLHPPFSFSCLCLIPIPIPQFLVPMQFWSQFVLLDALIYATAILDWHRAMQKSNKDAGMAWPWRSLQFASRAMRNFSVSAQLEHQNFDSIWLKTGGVEHCNVFWEKKRFNKKFWTVMRGKRLNKKKFRWISTAGTSKLRFDLVGDARSWTSLGILREKRVNTERIKSEKKDFGPLRILREKE